MFNNNHKFNLNLNHFHKFGMDTRINSHHSSLLHKGYQHFDVPFSSPPSIPSVDSFNYNFEFDTINLNTLFIHNETDLPEPELINETYNEPEPEPEPEPINVPISKRNSVKKLVKLFSK